VTTLDCQSWLVAYVYIVDGWKYISILLMLEQVVNGGRAKHIMGKHASIWGFSNLDFGNLDSFKTIFGL